MSSGTSTLKATENLLGRAMLASVYLCGRSLPHLFVDPGPPPAKFSLQVLHMLACVGDQEPSLHSDSALQRDLATLMQGVEKLPGRTKDQQNCVTDALEICDLVGASAFHGVITKFLQRLPNLDRLFDPVIEVGVRRFFFEVGDECVKGILQGVNS